MHIHEIRLENSCKKKSFKLVLKLLSIRIPKTIYSKSILIGLQDNFKTCNNLYFLYKKLRKTYLFMRKPLEKMG